jgi:ketosteroid isomerase-like protein
MFERFERGDVKGIAPFFATDAEVSSIVAGGTIRGREAVASVLARLFEDGGRVEATTFSYDADGKGHVAVTGRLRVHDEHGLVDVPAAWVYEIVNDEIVRARAYKSAAAAESAFREGYGRSTHPRRAA